ncbi:hypothetical protein [Bacillus sp. V5-8f]|uniref:hypothetical protein n=1 Tax=Bacillus sp. V5-8f TaxID=2053044 RepID=UPI0027E5479E|nr:hypothetical protein [Bacillus sp. V5-8f]
MNEIEAICEKVGPNIDEVADGMARMNGSAGIFFRRGIGYGGSRFQKDTKALVQVPGNSQTSF